MAGTRRCLEVDSNLHRGLDGRFRAPPNGPTLSRIPGLDRPVALGAQLVDWQDVLIEAEEIVGIVLLFEASQLRVVSPVGGFDCRWSLIPKVVDVGIGSSEAVQYRSQILCPTDAFLCHRRIAPGRHDVDAVMNPSKAERRLRDRHTTGGAMHVLNDYLCLFTRHSLSVIDDASDCFVG